MNKLIPVLSLVLLTSAFANDQATQSPTSPPKNSVHRYLVERTFPAGALKGLDAATKKKVNANNASVGVRRVQSYANADETKIARACRPPGSSRRQPGPRLSTR